VQVSNLPTSLPTSAFNALLCEALNANEAGDGVTHFAMLHADLAVDGFWLDTLMDVMEERDADLVSAVNAIKDARRLTSSGVALPAYAWKPLRRFTMYELVRWPMTFDAAQIGYEGFVLLHNTGCWLADLRRPVFHEADERGELRAFFTVNDRIVRKNGKWAAEVEPEDWFFSRRLFDLGAKTIVTRRVLTCHFGMEEHDNWTDNGTRKHDTEVDAEWTRDIKEVLLAR